MNRSILPAALLAGVLLAGPVGCTKFQNDQQAARESAVTSPRPNVTADGAIITSAKNASAEGLTPKGPLQQGHFRGLAVGDLDGDGAMEIVAGNFLNGTIHVWYGQKTGEWPRPTVLNAGGNPRAIRIVDVDGDSRPDIVAAVSGKNSGIFIWTNVDGKRFQRRKGPGQGEDFYDLHVGDLNYDGRADLIAVKADAGRKDNIRLWLNVGPHQWKAGPAPAAAYALTGVSIADLNQDGLFDILAAARNPGGGLIAWLGKGSKGQLNWGNPNVIAKGDFWSVSAVDLNGDGILDLLSTGRDTGIPIWQGLGKGRLNRMASPITSGSFWQAVPLDRNNDGLIDIVGSAMDGKGLQLWNQDSRLGWVAQRLVLPAQGNYPNLVVADLDGDGRPDLGAASHGKGVPLWPGFARTAKVTPEKDRTGKPKILNLPLIPGTRLSSPEAEAASKPAVQGPLGANPKTRQLGEYVIGEGDVLSILIWQGIQAETRQVQVSERGLVSFGYVDNIQAAGLTVKELDDILTQKLAKFIKSPRIDINIVKFGSKIIRVMGSVVRPQTYNIDKAVTVLDAILLAGGHIAARTKGDLSRVRVQSDGNTRTINLLRYISGNGSQSDNPFLGPGDLVFVPESSDELEEADRIFIFGESRRPGVYPFSFNMRVLDAVARSGGFTEWGLKEEIRIIRGDPERPEVIQADLKAMLERGDRRGNHLLKPNDVVFIPRSFIGDLSEFVKQVSPILDFLFYPARFREAYSINSNLLKFDVGGPSRRRAERDSEGTFVSGATNITLN
ncbi:MAG: FG-GAP-like repeat-containing protein [bacterium]|nr:FG-GAP-like repeat-containing protein [bacterium]